MASWSGTNLQDTAGRREADLGWVGAHWVVGAAFLALGFLALAPFIGVLVGAPLLLIFLHLPIYMIHQVEEHGGDRFRRFVNGLFGGQNVLTTGDVLVINLPLVWGVNLAALYAAFIGGPGYGLVAPYAMLLNGLAHVVVAARTRTYNPGLITSVLLFLPLGIATIVVVAHTRTGSIPFHIIGFVLAAIIHLGIMLRLLYRVETLKAAAAG